MTEADLDAKFARQASSLLPWRARVIERIEAKLDDALAHAQKAITESLLDTPDGRPTFLQVNRSPSFQAALSRLDELWTWLCGPSKASLDGVLRDAREAFYADAFEAWKAFVPIPYRVMDDPVPTQANLRAVRGAVIHGMDLRTELSSPFRWAGHSLRAAVTLAGRRAAASRERALRLKTWRAKTVRSIGQAVERALSDGQMEADTRAGRDLVHPDYLE